MPTRGATSHASLQDWRGCSLDLPKQDAITLAMYLEELRLYASQHRQVEAEVAKMAESDPDCQLLLSHPGISSFTAVAMKARIGLPSVLSHIPHISQISFV
jgi:transposase